MSDPVIEFRGARLGYPGTVVLDHVDLTIDKGEVVAVLGASGSGKTTLLQTLLGLVAPLSGDVELLGRAVTGVDRQEREQLFSRVGVVFQQNALFSDLTVAENLGVVAHQQTSLHDDIVRELTRLRLRSVGLEGFEERRPDRLSGGQRKRLAFARAIMLEPEILFCDEPTAGLDPLTSSRIAELIGQLAHDLGATMVMITHDADLIGAIATRVLVIEGGAIYADGSFAELSRSTDSIVAGLLRGDSPEEAGA